MQKYEEFQGEPPRSICYLIPNRAEQNLWFSPLPNICGDMQDLPLMSAGISTKHFQHVFTNLPSVPRPFGETLQTSWVHFVKTIHTVLKKIASDDFPPPFLSFYRLLKYYVILSKCSNNHSCFDYKQRKF